jgi:hypothetical protein
MSEARNDVSVLYSKADILLFASLDFTLFQTPPAPVGLHLLLYESKHYSFPMSAIWCSESRPGELYVIPSIISNSQAGFSRY